MTLGSIAVLLTTEPSGARLPAAKQTVDVSPDRASLIGGKDHVVGIDAIAIAQQLRRLRRSEASH